jgi:VanZ family protein
MTWDLLFFLGAITLISAGCLAPAGWLPILPHDKWLHFIAFCGLTLLAGRIAPDWPHLQFWLLGLVLAGLAIEVLQHYVPGRSFCWRDMAANAAGIATAVALTFLLQHL